MIADPMPRVPVKWERILISQVCESLSKPVFLKLFSIIIILIKMKTQSIKNQISEILRKFAKISAHKFTDLASKV